MAIKVERKVVCDFGERHKGEVRQYRITVDGESKTLDLCPTCATPIVRVWERGGDAKPASSRMRVVTMAEIENKKKPPSPE